MIIVNEKNYAFYSLFQRRNINKNIFIITNIVFKLIYKI